MSTQLAQTLADSHGPLVVSTAAGSFLVLAGVISTPGLSQIFGCTPVGPVGWGQAFLATAVAASLSALAPAVLERIGSKVYESVVDDDDAGRNQQGVDLPNRGRQQPDTDHDEGIGSGEAHSFGHNSRQAKPRDSNGSRK